MTDSHSICFFLMPFTPDSIYFYSFLKSHIEKNPKIKCDRADQSGDHGSLLEVIINHIEKSDVIIADCSGGNPNVMFELGIAHNKGKDIIYITKDKAESIPSDIRHFYFLNYEKNKPHEFFNLMDEALKKIFSDRYDQLYKKALEFHALFNKETQSNTLAVTKEEFIQLMESAKETQKIPALNDNINLKSFLLPRIIKNSDESKIMKKIGKWLTTR
jgi:nucleoside 2-deoxyribosyltransferase